MDKHICTCAGKWSNDWGADLTACSPVLARSDHNVFSSAFSTKWSCHFLWPITSLQNDFVVAPRHVQEEEFETILIHVLCLVLILAEPSECKLAHWCSSPFQNRSMFRQVRITSLPAPGVCVSCHVKLITYVGQLWRGYASGSCWILQGQSGSFNSNTYLGSGWRFASRAYNYCLPQVQ